MAKPWTKLTVDVSFNLRTTFQVLDFSDKGRVFDSRKIGLSVTDHFLYSGKFNSVLGPDGFGLFKDQLKDVLKKVNDDDFGANYINLDKMFEALITSGIYYVEEHMPEELSHLKTNSRWLTAYRYIAKNFPSIPYKDFREIVKRFQESSGHSLYITPNDSDFLKSLSERNNLFREVQDPRAALLPMSQKDLKIICDKVGAKPARSIEDTVARILEVAGNEILTHIPEAYRSRKSLTIKDTELASGQDIIELDTYIRLIAKAVRDDFVHFIDARRRWRLYAERKLG